MCFANMDEKVIFEYSSALTNYWTTWWIIKFLVFFWNFSAFLVPLCFFWVEEKCWKILKLYKSIDTVNKTVIFHSSNSDDFIQLNVHEYLSFQYITNITSYQLRFSDLTTFIMSFSTPYFFLILSVSLSLHLPLSFFLSPSFFLAIVLPAIT